MLDNYGCKHTLRICYRVVKRTRLNVTLYLHIWYLARKVGHILEMVVVALHAGSLLYPT